MTLPGGFPDLQGLLAQAAQVQAQLADAQSALAHREVSGTAGGGLVTAVVNGTGELLRLTIDRAAVDPEDTETLADLVVAAVRDACRQAEDLLDSSMGPVAGVFAGPGGIPDFAGLAGLAGLGGGGGMPDLGALSELLGLSAGADDADEDEDEDDDDDPDEAR